MTDVVVPAPESREAKIAGAVERFGESAPFVWDVYALDEKSRRRAMVCRISGLDFDEHAFGRKYGPGEYQRALRVEGARAPQVLCEAFTIDARINAPDPSMQAERKPEQAEVFGALRSILERLERLESRPPVTPQVSQESVGVRDLVALFTPMIQAAATPKDSVLTLKDVLPLLQQKSTAGELAELMKVAREIAPSGGDEGLGQLGAAFAEMIRDARQTVPAVTTPPRPLAALPSVSTPNAAPQVVTPIVVPQPFPGAASVAAGLRQFVPMLKDQATLTQNLPRLVAALEQEIQSAGGRCEDVVSKFGSAEKFTEAFVTYAPHYSEQQSIVRAIADAFFDQYEDEPEAEHGKPD